MLTNILKAINMPKSTYMYWNIRLDRKDKDLELGNMIRDIQKDNPNYGYRRVQAVLKDKGIIVNKKRIQRVMKKYNLNVESYTRKSRKLNTYDKNKVKAAPNIINRRFHTNIPYQKITTDTSEFKYYTKDNKIGKLYLDPFLDMYNSEIISYSISPTPSALGIMNALNKAIEVTSKCKYQRIFHSDRGWAYSMRDYIKELKSNRIRRSMSRKGNCHDNSPMENFFGLLKQEIYYGKIYSSYEELKYEIEKFIEYYNKKRIKAKLGYLSPVEYRLQAM